MRNAAVLFTGGKDSTYALHLAYLQGYNIRVLASIIPEYEYSMLYHKPYTEILRLQAESMGFPLETITINRPDKEINALKVMIEKLTRAYNIDTLVTGAVLSDYQRLLFGMMGDEYGVFVYNPLWRINQERYLLELIENGIEFILISINTYGLDPRFLGRVIDRDDAEEIIARARRYGFNPSFEGGEAETLVVNAPLFRRRLRVEGSVVEKGLYEYVFIVKNAILS
jgi:diphthine-ammonia ligase